MVKNQHFSQFDVISRNKQGISLIIPCLFNDKERASILQTLLLMRKAINGVQFDLQSDSVTINYNSVLFSEQDLLKLLAVVLGNFSKKPKEFASPEEDVSDGCSRAKNNISFSVDGMACASCALFIKMVLTRHTDVISAEIDFDKKTGFVIGYLTMGQVFEVIEKNGFKAVLERG